MDGQTLAKAEDRGTVGWLISILSVRLGRVDAVQAYGSSKQTESMHQVQKENKMAIRHSLPLLNPSPL